LEIQMGFFSSSDDDNAKTLGKLAGGATVGGIGAAASGMSAAGMTSALATAGGVVGGGMAAGLLVTAAAPIAVGGAVYGLYKWLKD
jgi:hypothetical protein